MRIVEHRWQTRWRDKLDREFKYEVRRGNEPMYDTLRYSIQSKLWPCGTFLASSEPQYFVDTLVIIRTTTSNWAMNQEVEEQLSKKIQELKHMMYRVLLSGYSTTVPIQDEWSISK